VENRWESDQQVLAAVVELYEKDGNSVRRNEVHAALEDLDDDAIDQALRRLSSTGFIVGRGTGQAAVVAVVGVTEKGLRASGFWPSQDEAIDRMLQALEEAAEREPDPERQSKLRSVVTSFRSAGREVMIDVASAMLQAGVGVG
jgi:DNA-binding PadR family transcriptional regulator